LGIMDGSGFLRRLERKAALPAELVSRLVFCLAFWAH
jgi:hypothetical protein